MKKSDTIYKIISGRYERSLNHRDEIDKKTASITSFIGLILSTQLLIARYIQTLNKDVIDAFFFMEKFSIPAFYILFFSGILFLISIFLGICGLWPRDWYEISSRRLLDKYKDSNRDYILNVVSGSLADYSCGLDDTIRTKSKFLKWEVWVFGAGIILVFWVFLSIIFG